MTTLHFQLEFQTQKKGKKKGGIRSKIRTQKNLASCHLSRPFIDSDPLTDDGKRTSHTGLPTEPCNHRSMKKTKEKTPRGDQWTWPVEMERRSSHADVAQTW
ncbi:hypothetical protein HRI_000426900 [Hibiscus trionum]|uniref:Uncharacterized protein n=1 Tax=Hibiscus trionum TaxID=183268 RepID=A0A9W7GZA4_HIBTR|nr:hypothetical protein HRI_000426900 [Hibiscus trionum]